MIAQRYKDMLSGKSVIRQISEWSTARGSEIGYENVFDYSLGNPSVPCPEHFTKTCIDLLQTKEPVTLHGYSPTLTIPAVRKAVAESLNRRFGMDYGMEHIFMATGAAGALAHAMRCVAVPGQDIITFAPFFPEYKPYVEGAGLNLKVVPPRTKDFQIDFDAFDAMLDENTAAVLNRLFAQTSLQTSFSINMLALVNNQTQPKILSLRHILDEYLTFQEDLIVRRTRYDLRKAEERAKQLLEQESIVRQANAKAMALLNDASSRAQQMVEEAQKQAEETVNDAQAKATAIRTEASTRSREMKQASYEFAENILRTSQEVVAKSLGNITTTRQALAEAASQAGLREEPTEK